MLRPSNCEHCGKRIHGFGYHAYHLNQEKVLIVCDECQILETKILLNCYRTV